MRTLLICLIMATTASTAEAGVFDPHCGQDVYIQEKMDDEQEIIPMEGMDVNARNKEICDMYAYENKTYKEIGEKYGITKERVGDICRKEFKRRHALESGLGVSMRAYTVLKKAGVRKIGDLRTVKIRRIQSVPGAGVKVMEEIADLARRHSIVME